VLSYLITKRKKRIGVVSFLQETDQDETTNLTKKSITKSQEGMVLERKKKVRGEKSLEISVGKKNKKNSTGKKKKPNSPRRSTQRKTAQRPSANKPNSLRKKNKIFHTIRG